MNTQAINSNRGSAPVSARCAVVGAPVLVIGTDGKVIISTLPGSFAAGADLFRLLYPADRERFALATENLRSDRFFFCSQDGAFILLSSLCFTHGVILAIKSDAAQNEAFKRTAAQYGFEELNCQNPAKDRPQYDSAEIGSVISFALGIERLLSRAGEASLTTKKGAEKFLSGFSLLAGVPIRIKRVLRKMALLEGVDNTVLGLAVLLAGAVSACHFNRLPIHVSFTETADLCSVKVELSIEFDPENNPCLPREESLEELLGSIFALKCKNFHIRYAGSSLVFSLCPSVFDPDAEGIMQGDRIRRDDVKKGRKK